MDYIDQPTMTFASIPCYLCGTLVDPPNPANMCIPCIRTQVDITEDIPKQVTVQWCKGCGKYFEPPNRWLAANLESKELLMYCLRRIPHLNKIKLVDATFIWTEPHSKRLKVKLTIQKEVFSSTILEQSFAVELVIHNYFCPECHKIEAGDDHTWSAVAQVRQRVQHKRTFYWLEQLILKHAAHNNTLSIKECPDGLDFFFANQSHCVKFIDFLHSFVPLTYKKSSQLVSHDPKSNIFNYKYTFSVEIPPICREDIVCIPKKLANQLGNISQIALVHKITNQIHLIDPFSLQSRELQSNIFWQNSFRSIGTRSNLVEFMVMDVETTQKQNGKYVYCELVVAKSSDLGKNSRQYFTGCHLGHILNPGDTVLGYDIASMNLNSSDLYGFKEDNLPEVIIVKKIFPNYRRKKKERLWKLKALAKEQEIARKGEDRTLQDYEEFLRDLEEDPESRQQIILYKDEKKVYSHQNDMDVDDDEVEEDFPEVRIDELLEDLNDMNISDQYY